MSFGQLYYTSCDRGPLGYDGFQFNAVTDGISAQVMRRVEGLTFYEPPLSLAYPQSPAELARCPVNLCFEAGPVTVLANTQYVGRDSARRFGNYFAHALATTDLNADDPGLLPIELWRSACWTTRPAGSATLPPLDGPLPVGPLNRERAAAFLAAHPHRGQVVALLGAVGLAQPRPGRSVLVVEETADKVAAWFAVISFLLPPRWVRRLSFATYLSRPSWSRLPLLGTVQETDLDLGANAARRFYLFDFPGERFTEVPADPLASLCAGIGIRDLPKLWDRAEALADGARQEPGPLHAWYPVVAAAAALGGGPVTETDLAAATGWLERADALAAGPQAAIARALGAHPAISTTQRHVIRKVGQRTGDAGLWQQALYEILEERLLNRADGAATRGDLSGAELAPLRARLAAKSEEQLRLARSGLDVLAVLDWAARAGLPLRGGLLTELGRSWVATLLAAHPPRRPLPALVRARLRNVAGCWPPLRAGIVADLASRPEPEARDILSGLAGELLTEAETREYLALRSLLRNPPPC